MSSDSNQSINKTEIIAIIEEMLRRLRHRTSKKDRGLWGWGFYDLRKFYEAIYEFCRHTHLYPDFRQLLTVEDKNHLKEYLPKAIGYIIAYTPGLLSQMDPSWLNIARARLSQITFLDKELLDLYKEVGGNALSHEFVDRLNELEISRNVLCNDIEDWTHPCCGDTVDDPDDVPNLNGVPLSHDWWPDEYREM